MHPSLGLNVQIIENIVLVQSFSLNNKIMFNSIPDEIATLNIDNPDGYRQLAEQAWIWD